MEKKKDEIKKYEDNLKKIKADIDKTDVKIKEEIDLNQ